MIAPAITAPPTTPAATPGPHPPPLHPHPRPLHWAEASVVAVAKAAAIVAAASKQVSVLFIVVPRGVANCVGVAQQELGSPRIMISLNLSELSPSLLLTDPC
jgi:hypothetical protein